MHDAGERILRMQVEMEEQRLPAPEFDSSAHRMVVTLRNGTMALGKRVRILTWQASLSADVV